MQLSLEIRQRWIQDFPDPLFGQFFAENCMKMKKILPLHDITTVCEIQFAFLSSQISINVWRYVESRFSRIPVLDRLLDHTYIFCEINFFLLGTCQNLWM